MNSVLKQLSQWRFREQALSFAWGVARWFAIFAVVLALACATDWIVDRYSGSASWRKALRSTRILAPSDPLAVGHTPFGLRLMMTAGQITLTGLLVYYFIVRPLRRTPAVDELAGRAEKAYKEFDHRLVTAIQLNRPNADTRGMSQTLIANVTREATDIAAKHNFLSLINYSRLKWAGIVILPMLLAWGIFAAINPPLAFVLVKRQALLPVSIPREIKLENDTKEVWPTGAEVPIRFKVSGSYSPAAIGTLVVVPYKILEEKHEDGTPKREYQPPEYYDLTNEKNADGSPTDIFSVKLPPASVDFHFQARLEEGRTDERSYVRFEAPPQLAREDPNNPPLTAEQELPDFLGKRPNGDRYIRKNEGWTRGEVIDALPGSTIIVYAQFNKPVEVAQLIRIERDGILDRDLPPLPASQVLLAADKKSATFGFVATPRMIAYRIELKDSYGFSNPSPIRRTIRMWDDRPPSVEFKPESLRNPNPKAYDGRGNVKDYEFDMALSPDGVISVIYNAHSEVGLRAANIRYRVIPKGVQFDLYPEDYKAIQHPRDDPNLIVFDRLPLKKYVPGKKAGDPGAFVADLGLFTNAFTRTVEILGFEFLVDTVLPMNWNKVNLEFYPIPSRDPDEEPGELDAGGRMNFEVSGLEKKLPEVLPDGKTILKRAKLEIGDTVEVYVEVFDKLPGADGKPDLKRPAGYTKEAKRKIVVTELETALALRARDEARTKLRDKVDQLAKDQFDVFKPKPKP
ncbi:MAG: hypothetical protein K8U57_16455 [Planctomycetes bacterium]|nr:hypothetical protein [Planctomycetota bacterium]